MILPTDKFLRVPVVVAAAVVADLAVDVVFVDVVVVFVDAVVVVVVGVIAETKKINNQLLTLTVLLFIIKFGLSKTLKWICKDRDDNSDHDDDSDD